MRKSLASEFSKIYLIDLGGDVYKHPELSGTTHNVFGIKLRVVIVILVKRLDKDVTRNADIFYASTGKNWRREEKCAQLETWRDVTKIRWKKLEPDANQNWLTEGMSDEYPELLPLSWHPKLREGLFDLKSLGVSTNRDDVAYNFSPAQLKTRAQKFVTDFNAELDRYKRARPSDCKDLEKFVDGWVNYDLLPWSETLKRKLISETESLFDEARIVDCLYRPFSKRALYLGVPVVDRPSLSQQIFPGIVADNTVFVATLPGSDKPFMIMAADRPIDLHLVGSGAGAQCFPFFAYNEDGTNRRENITDWALAEFRKHYADDSISKWDIFYYTYALLHHPEYRTRYAANLKRELPRIPMAPAFRDYARIGAALMNLHIDYEKQPEYPLERRETGKLNWRVDKMALSKDKTQLKYNDFLTLSGIPPQVYDYRLGNRSALEWVIDQYRVSTDARSGIVNDPNRDDDPQYIVRLIGQVVAVSLETVKLVKELEKLSIDEA
jgi:predicted helicase